MARKDNSLYINSKLPTLDLEDFEPDVAEDKGVGDRIKGSTHYGLIGIGQCGGGILKSFFDLGYKKSIAFNSSVEELDFLEIPKKQKLAIDSASLSKHQILHLLRQTFGSGIDHIMVCFSAGSLFGSRNAVSVIETAKQYARYVGLKNPGNKVGAIVAVPTKSELKSKAERVENVMTVIKGQLSPLVIVDNDKIVRNRPKTTVKSFWPGVNGALATLFDSFNRLSAKSTPYTCFDPADYRSIIDCPGFATMGMTEIKKTIGDFTISKAVMNNLKNIMFADGFDLSTAKTAGCIVVAGKKLMAENKSLQGKIDYAFDTLSNIACNATLHRGIYEDGKNTVRVYTILSGLRAYQCK